MREIPVHRAMRAGMFIYILCISFCFCFGSRAQQQSDRDAGIVLILDQNSSGADQDATPTKKLGSQSLGEEDDDDSARGLFNEFMFHFESASSSLQKPLTSYSSNDKNITTPPPWC